MTQRSSSVNFNEAEIVEHCVECAGESAVPAAATMIQKLPYSEFRNNPPAKWLLDSGCPYDIINEDDVSPPDKENIQSRLRGLTLMAYSNKFGSMVLATGNKSEYAAGYATLYGDMCGGYAPIKDVWKTTVFELCKWRNNNVPRLSPIKKDKIIPERIITRPPSAELRPDQQDTDSLPEYDVLDPILVALTEEMADIKTIISRGFDREVVEKASQLLFRAEYKRFQAAPGPKITTRAFGRDRRLPLTSGFRPAYHNR